MDIYIVTLTLTFESRSSFSIGSEPVATFSENCVRIGASLQLEFCSLTDRLAHTHIHTNKLQWKYNPSTILWRCKKNLPFRPITLIAQSSKPERCTSSAMKLLYNQSDQSSNIFTEFAQNPIHSKRDISRKSERDRQTHTYRLGL